MNILFKSLLFLLMMWEATPGYAQKAESNPLIDQLKKRNRTLHQEKVHLHFDKPFYSLGDTIWFAGYLVDADSNSPTDRSHILHVDLINDRNVVCQTMQLIVNTGFTAGELPLSDSLSSGNYHIRAYTNWMRNFDDSYFFYKQITVLNPVQNFKGQHVAPNNITAPTINIKPLYNVQFFPEGGQLVNGISSTIAFKAINNNGLGVPIKGKILDDQNITITTFSTQHAGMGVFQLTPQRGRTYIAVVTYPDDTAKHIALPVALESGYALSADNSNKDSLSIVMKASSDLVGKGSLTFIPLTNGAPLFYMKTKFPDKQITITIPKDKLPGGILQLSLLDSADRPVAERLVFNRYRQGLNIDTINLKNIYQKREPVEVSLFAKDFANKPVIGSFSVAVTNADLVETREETEQTIFSNLLLTSDLKGFVETPNYYFSHTSTQKDAELDHLMLTQGWRRYTWSDLKLENPILKYVAEGQLQVNGKITADKNVATANIPVNLLAGQLLNGFLIDTVTDAQGRFAFNLSDSVRDLPIRIQVKPHRASIIYHINLDIYAPAPVSVKTPDNLEISALSGPPISDERALAKYAGAWGSTIKGNESRSLFNQSIRLKEVAVRDNNLRPKLTNSHSSNLNGPGQADRVILPETLDKMPDLTTIDVLLPGTVVTANGLFQRSNVGTHTPSVLILIDEVDAGITGLRSLSPRDVESIEYLKSPAYAGIYGIRGSGGVLVITTKKGDSAKGNAKTSNSISFKLPYYNRKEFYSPVYLPSANSGNLMDLRTTVYWAPDVVTDKTGHAKLKYFNTDVAGNYRIVIEGISAKGYLGRQVYIYKVQ